MNTPKKAIESAQAEAVRRVVQLVKEGHPLKEALGVIWRTWPRGAATWDTIERRAKKEIEALPARETKEASGETI
jgi:hypothetical protein